MDPEVPDSSEPYPGLDFDVGVSLHEWATRWSELEDERELDPGEALSGALDLLDEMYRELHVPTRAPDAAATEDLSELLDEVRDVRRRWQADEPVDGEELEDAWDVARDAYDRLAAGGSESADGGA
jgi:hypothetical protein